MHNTMKVIKSLTRLSPTTILHEMAVAEIAKASERKFREFLNAVFLDCLEIGATLTKWYKNNGFEWLLPCKPQLKKIGVMATGAICLMLADWLVKVGFILLAISLCVAKLLLSFGFGFFVGILIVDIIFGILFSLKNVYNVIMNEHQRVAV